jgi:hypothetical protein
MVNICLGVALGRKTRTGLVVETTLVLATNNSTTTPFLSGRRRCARDTSRKRKEAKKRIRTEQRWEGRRRDDEPGRSGASLCGCWRSRESRRPGTAPCPCSLRTPRTPDTACPASAPSAPSPAARRASRTASAVAAGRRSRTTPQPMPPPSAPGATPECPRSLHGRNPPSDAHS